MGDVLAQETYMLEALVGWLSSDDGQATTRRILHKRMPAVVQRPFRTWADDPAFRTETLTHSLSIHVSTFRQVHEFDDLKPTVMPVLEGFLYAVVNPIMNNPVVAISHPKPTNWNVVGQHDPATMSRQLQIKLDLDVLVPAGWHPPEKMGWWI